jgi:hypothetical protein
MSHRRFWILGIVSFLILSTISLAHAEDDDSLSDEIRAGKVNIIRNENGTTYIQTDRIKLKSEPLKVRSSRYKHGKRIHLRQIERGTVVKKNSIETSVDREVTTQTNDSSIPTSSNKQVTRIRGNNRTVIQSSGDER